MGDLEGFLDLFSRGMILELFGTRERRKILAVLFASNRIGFEELAERTLIGPRKLTHELNVLRATGVVVETGGVIKLVSQDEDVMRLKKLILSDIRINNPESGRLMCTHGLKSR